MPDVQEALTRKLGPLPAWGWGVAVGGAVIVFRLIRPKSGSSTVGSSAPTSVGSGAVIGTAGDATPTDVFSGANSLVEQLQAQVDDLQKQIETQGEASTEQTTLLASLKDQLDAANTKVTEQGSTIAGLSGTISTLTDFQGLQTKLAGLINQRSAALSTISLTGSLLSDHKARLRACTTSSCRTSETAYVNQYQKSYDAAIASAASLNTQITGIQSQLNGSAT